MQNPSLAWCPSTVLQLERDSLTPTLLMRAIRDCRQPSLNVSSRTRDQQVKLPPSQRWQRNLRLNVHYIFLRCGGNNKRRVPVHPAGSREGRWRIALFSQLQEFVAQCFSTFLLMSPSFGPWYEKECYILWSFALGCIDSLQMARVWSAQSVQNS